MAQNPTITKLGEQQIIQRVYDEANDQLRTTISGVSPGVILPVILAGPGATGLDVVDELDTPLTPANTINGSGGALVQVVASLSHAVTEVHLMDTGGRYLGLYLGAPSAEALKMIINPGSDSVVPVIIPVGSRITLRSMETVGPVAGFISINFLG